MYLRGVWINDLNQIFQNVIHFARSQGDAGKLDPACIKSGNPKGGICCR